MSVPLIFSKYEDTRELLGYIKNSIIIYNDCNFIFSIVDIIQRLKIFVNE